MNISIREYKEFLSRYLRGYKIQIVLLMIVLGATITLQLLNPQIIRYFLDVATSAAQISGQDAEIAKALKELTQAAVIYLSLAVLQQGATVLSTYLSETIAWGATNTLRLDLADHCQHLDLSFHNSHTPGELIERIDGDVNALANFFSQFIIQIIGNIVLLSGIIGLLFLEDWRVGSVIGAFAVLSLAIMLRFRNNAVPHWAAERQASAELFGFLEERLAGTEDIRANGGEAYTLQHFFRLMRTLLQKSLRAGMVVNLLLNTMSLLFAAGNATAFALGAYLFLSGEVTIGTVYLFFHYTNMLQRPIDGIVHQIADLQKASAGLLRIRQLFLEQSRIWSSEELVPSNGSRGENRNTFWKEGQALSVEFEAVTFAYDDQGSENLNTGSKEVVLKNISFNLPSGKILGLLGRTGSGKTTLTRLLFRFYDPVSGYVKYNAGTTSEEMVDIRRIPLPELRRQVGLVTQNIQLFHASVRDNLTFFERAITDGKILDAIDNLDLGGWLSSLPDGLDSMLASGGGGLSAGQAQLLAFVRIFLRNPGLIVLDEASSRLDPATETMIEHAISKLVQNRTAIVIAHKLETVQRADEIIILDNGRILEKGVRKELLSDPSTYFSNLMRTGLDEVLV